ncbi:MAG: patatin-like phospholipase family protein, partial [Candidatus Competibacteraceae bacterium]|nr:patatin-like phospholipase family protein [Candidatus Competibacteraceae bacterium]
MTEPKAINLALQGGGAHGAFTWGVLDRLLTDQRIRIEGISGTSAGAMNAAVLADGMRKGGPEQARQSLHDFWRAVSNSARFSPLQRTALDALLSNWNLDHSPGYVGFDLLTRLTSPYDLNPLNINPLRDLVAELIDFDSARRCDQVKLFISATNVHTGRVRVFRQTEITADVLMASACLPLVFQAVEIDNVPYWDGGYTGNPALFPLFYECTSNDIVIVQINPQKINYTPRSAREILNRLNEITFNASIQRELRSIEFVDRLLEQHRLDPEHYSK